MTFYYFIIFQQKSPADSYSDSVARQFNALNHGAIFKYCNVAS